MRKGLVSLVVFGVAFALPVTKIKAEPEAYGQDYYGLQSLYWNAAASALYSKGGRAFGHLDTTFGTSLSPIKLLMDSARPAFYRVHIINAVCIRNQRCGKYELGYGYTVKSFDAAVRAGKITPKFKNRVKIYCSLFEDYPNTKLVISPALEHDLSIKSFRVLADATLQACPNAQLANSPDGGVAIERYRGSWVERHGVNAQADADIVSLDGSSATQINIDAFLTKVRRFPHVKFLNLWEFTYNCASSRWEDPRERRNCSSPKTLELMNHLYDPVPVKPPLAASQCKRTVPFVSPQIWKPLAESSPNPDPNDHRGELPVLISKEFGKGSVNVITFGGAAVGSVGYYDTYLDQGFRWYSGYPGGSKQSGYEYQEAAQKISNSPWVWLNQGNKCAGPLLTGKRQGEYKNKVKRKGASKIKAKPK